MLSFNTFYFESFSFDKNSLIATFRYSFDEKQYFQERINFFSKSFKLNKNISDSIINNLMFHLHIALWISYYKLFPTKKLKLKFGFLNDKQIKFWKKFYLNWLWEFFIKNDFDFQDILNFENQNSSSLCLVKNNRFDICWDKSILLWWGWKDSIVSSILLEEEKKEFATFVFWKIDKIKKNTLKILSKKNMLVERNLSENLFRLNELWYYNWHVPITWIISFVSVVSAYLYNIKNIILSNEKSANQWNVFWKWLNINHQYSKSWEFENDFRKYIFDNISTNINYYSKLRDKFEIEIAEIFSKKAKKYFKYFSSCNWNFKITSKKNYKKWLWCCECEKCSFVYLILSAFLSQKDMFNIFWQNLFDKKELLFIYKWLLWLTQNKPFECVWTYDESLKAFKMNLFNYKNWFNSFEKMPFILKKLETEI